MCLRVCQPRSLASKTCCTTPPLHTQDHSLTLHLSADPGCEALKVTWMVSTTLVAAVALCVTQHDLRYAGCQFRNEHSAWGLLCNACGHSRVCKVSVVLSTVLFMRAQHHNADFVGLYYLSCSNNTRCVLQKSTLSGNQPQLAGAERLWLQAKRACDISCVQSFHHLRTMTNSCLQLCVLYKRS